MPSKGLAYIMTLSNQAYRGCRDLFPKDKRKLEYILAHIKDVCEKFGYEPYDGPLLETIELYQAKSGQELVSEQLYQFTDRGGRNVAIRPEMTPTLARMVSQVHREITKPIRWYAFPNLMRYEKPQRGRLREHWQFNCDIFGAPAQFGEYETLNLLITLLKSFGATSEQFNILINDRQIVDSLFTHVLKLSDEKALKLYKIIDKSKKVSHEGLIKMLNEDFSSHEIEIIESYLKIENLAHLKDFTIKYNIPASFENINALFTKFEASDSFNFLKYDPAIVRGLDYYTGIVFEAFDLHPDNKRAICGGGSYANLLQIFNEPAMPGVGFGLGDVTLSDFLETHSLMPDFSTPNVDMIITFQDEELMGYAIEVCEALRVSTHKKIEFHPMSIKVKKAFQLAQKKQIDEIIFIGTDEQKNRSYSVKNTKTQESAQVLLTDIIKEKQG